jgi:hypothetical protein
VAAFLSVFWTMGYRRLGERLRRGVEQPELAPPRSQARRVTERARASEAERPNAASRQRSAASRQRTTRADTLACTRERAPRGQRAGTHTPCVVVAC